MTQHASSDSDDRLPHPASHADVARLLSGIASGGSSGTTIRADGTDDDALQALVRASAVAEVLKERLTDLQNREAQFRGDRQQLDADRTAFEQRARDYSAQVAQERAAQREQMAEIEGRLNAIAARETALEQQEQKLADQTDALKKKELDLRAALTRELDVEKAGMRQFKSTLEANERELKSRSELQDQQHAERMRQLEADAAAERETIRAEIRQELSEEYEDLKREQQEWAARYEAERDELRQQSEDFQQQRELFSEQMVAEQTRLRDEVNSQKEKLQAEQTELARRYRFQFEHLRNSRESFESELRDMRRQEQKFRTEKACFLEQHRLLRRQLDHYRILLLDREATVQRERRILDRTAKATEHELERLQSQFEELRQSVQLQHDRKAADLRQQETSLAEQAVRLDQRSRQLGAVKAELEQSQQELLEHRLALEEAQAELASGHSHPALTSRVEQARFAVRDFVAKQQASVIADLERLNAASESFAQKQEAFRKERREMFEALARREEELTATIPMTSANAEAGVVSRLREQLTSVERKWRADQLNAEATIRRLLTQLETDATAAIDATAAMQPPRSQEESDPVADAA